MKFKYKRYGNTLRPVIPIKLINKGSEIGYEVLVDSGADLCIFDTEVAELIGMDFKKSKKREVFGIGGKTSFYYLTEVEIAVGGWSYKIKADFMPNVAGNVMPYGVVGQQGFFEHFAIKFDFTKEQIDLKRK